MCHHCIGLHVQLTSTDLLYLYVCMQYAVSVCSMLYLYVCMQYLYVCMQYVSIKRSPLPSILCHTHNHSILACSARCSEQEFQTATRGCGWRRVEEVTLPTHVQCQSSTMIQYHSHTDPARSPPKPAKWFSIGTAYSCCNWPAIQAGYTELGMGRLKRRNLHWRKVHTVAASTHFRLHNSLILAAMQQNTSNMCFNRKNKSMQKPLSFAPFQGH